VALNRMTKDTEAEIACVRAEAMDAGAADCVAANHWCEEVTIVASWHA
jgi:methylenetetrahydrofolate dehydrogenase (NADP+)/methenyltetrahydrofolate cyclohydrolase/formyltetrahydrofolate synthetase